MHDAPAVVCLDALLEKAITCRASDIHLESLKECLLVRLRIDGILMRESNLESSLGLALISRIKVLASLNNAERRIPQDGSFVAQISKNTYDIRIATFPALYGEKVVLRLLDHSIQQHLLADIGLDSKTYSSLTALTKAPTGLLIVTGPTGSGKTTTLHSFLRAVKNDSKNIMTLEDPVEYTIDGVTQTPIQPALGFTFHKGLRSLLRMDPDVIMVGEMRDKETAHVAFQAAITGHLVMSTLHTTDAPSALVRLLDMSLEPYLITAALTVLLAQRLVRKLCMNCRYIADPTPHEQALMNRYGLAEQTFFKAAGCELCLNTGYYGRTGIFSYLPLSHDMKALIHASKDYNAFYAQALKEGMCTLLDDALLKIQQGITSLDEIARVL